MEAALGWLGDIIRTFIRVFPHIILVRATHAGVKFACGTDIIMITHLNGIRFPRFSPFRFTKTGIHFYWPLVTECEVVPIKRQTTNLEAQYLCTADNKTIGVSGILVYEIADVVKLLVETYDYEDTIRDLALAAVKEVIIKYDFKYLQEEGQTIDKELTKKLREQLKRFGVKTIRVTLSDFSQCKVLGLWGVGGDTVME